MTGWVLVVEDDHAIADVVTEALRDRGMAVEYAANDREAYGRIVDLPSLSALIVDVNLGVGVTGYDVARFARQVIPELPVFYISGSTPPDSHRAFGVPDSEFVMKPFRPHDLADKVTAGAVRAGRA